MNDGLRKLKNILSINHKKIEDFTEVKDMPSGPPWDLVKELYNQKSPIEKILATVFNGIATSRKKRLLFSATVLQEMLQADPNQSRKAISGKDYKAILGRLVQTRIIKCIERSSAYNSGGDKKAGYYEVVYPDIVDHVKFIDEQDNTAVANISKTSSSSSPSTSSSFSPKTSYEYESESEHESENECESEREKAKESAINKTIQKTTPPWALGPRRSSQTVSTTLDSDETTKIKAEISRIEIQLSLAENDELKRDLIYLKQKLNKLEAIAI